MIRCEFGTIFDMMYKRIHTGGAATKNDPTAIQRYKKRGDTQRDHDSKKQLLAPRVTQDKQTNAFQREQGSAGRPHSCDCDSPRSLCMALTRAATNSWEQPSTRRESAWGQASGVYSD